MTTPIEKLDSTAQTLLWTVMFRRYSYAENAIENMRGVCESLRRAQKETAKVASPGNMEAHAKIGKELDESKAKLDDLLILHQEAKKAFFGIEDDIIKAYLQPKPKKK